MVSVIILNNGEPNVVQFTFDNLYHELKDIFGSELLIKDRWFDLEGVKNRYVCFVEADCLVTPGYFKLMLDGFLSKGFSRSMGILSSATAINYWDNKIYGYEFTPNGVTPNRQPKSTNSFAVEVAYIPGSIIRMSMLKTCLAKLKTPGLHNDLVYLSSMLCKGFWTRSAESGGRGYRVWLNPKATYLTTEDYVNDLGKFPLPLSEEINNLFSRESI